jgi:hypothetical protein
MINYLRIDRQTKHVTLGIFEIAYTFAKTLAKKLIEVLKYVI